MSNNTCTMVTNEVRTRAMWRSRLGAALRTTLACTIVGCITLYCPVAIQRTLSFPALSYVVVIALVTEATLGDTVRGCWNALYGTIQGVVPGMLSLWLIGPARLSIATATLVVAATALVVVAPQSTHVIAKKIALAQIVLIYTFSSFNGVHKAEVLHPVHVAASTAVGAFASVLALLLPYPRLASYEVRKKCRQFNKNASERMKLFVKAFCAESNATANATMSRANSLTKKGTKILQTVKLMQESMQWERPLSIFMKPRYLNSSDRLQALELPLKGMEIALTSCPSFPVGVAGDENLKTLLLGLEEHITRALSQAKGIGPSESLTESETTKGDVSDNFLQTLHSATFPSGNDLPSFFFLFCMKLMDGRLTADHPQESKGATEKMSSAPVKKKSILGGWPVKINSERFIIALKCSLSLGLAVLFGMIYSKEFSCWSGLAVAVGMAFRREATFKSANLKAQGTVLGTIYGVLSCFVFQRLSNIRFLSLLPWIIFTSFLRLSRMFGQAGSASAIIGALIILGRKNYGPASEFAIMRISETFIGLACSISVELLLQPTRASTLAKIQLSNSLSAISECIELITLCSSIEEVKEKEKKLRGVLRKLGNFMGEAEAEPNFWFLPFHTACYNKLLGTLSKMADLLLFVTQAMESLTQDSQRVGIACTDLKKYLDGDLDQFKNMVSSSIRCLEKITLIKSLAKLEKAMNSGAITDGDVELGKAPNANAFKLFTADEEEIGKTISSFLQHSREVVDNSEAFEWDEKMKGQIILNLSAIGFCMDALIKQSKEIQKSVRELVQWENPSSQVNLCEIYCKVNALCT
ncbi:hypothetical protein Syun_002057 [Stephania yunnanensis]|uniref:Integral membrane bound transporter domain-containing protein n=1 Tax=Stephania yunnanensis TaxID=152371 RepID=A0AAP0LER5_9MAGN